MATTIRMTALAAVIGACLGGSVCVNHAEAAGNEQLTGWVYAALPLIVLALVLLLFGPRLNAGGNWLQARALRRFYDGKHA